MGWGDIMVKYVTCPNCGLIVKEGTLREIVVGVKLFVIEQKRLMCDQCIKNYNSKVR